MSLNDDGWAEMRRDWVRRGLLPWKQTIGQHCFQRILVIFQNVLLSSDKRPRLRPFGIIAAYFSEYPASSSATTPKIYLILTIKGFSLKVKSFKKKYNINSGEGFHPPPNPPPPPTCPLYNGGNMSLRILPRVNSLNIYKPVCDTINW